MSEITQYAPLPDPKLPIEAQEVTTLFAMLLYGEARGETPEGRAAVGNVVLNRVLSGKYPGGQDWRSVMLAPFQFSCFLQNDPNRAKLLEPTKHDSQEVWNSCYAIAATIYGGDGKDNTGRATHYFSTYMIKPPTWANSFIHTVDIGKHRFYRDPHAFLQERTSPGIDFDSHLTNG